MSRDSDPSRVKALTDAELIARFEASEADAEDPEQTALASEIERRGLDV